MKMKAYKKSKVVKTTICRKEYNVVSRGWDEPYWDDGMNFYPSHNKGTKHSNKGLMMYQVRMYKTWKHNRKTQWKEIN